MKQFFLAVVFLFAFGANNATAQKTSVSKINASINLNEVKDDALAVNITFEGKLPAEIVYRLPKTIPGTYSTANYGKYVFDFKAVNKKNEALKVEKIDENSFKISDAKNLKSITYYVNDTFDQEKGGQFGEEIFSPAGTNILAGVNFYLNTHGFIGYVDGLMNVPYTLKISHPESLYGATSMTDADASNTNDVFNAPRYSELIENPIMYSKPDYASFKVGDMDIIIAVYAPKGNFNAKMLEPEMKRMMTAQKQFLGSFNATKKYAVLLYLSDLQAEDAKGFGALEHPTSTTVVMPESLSLEQMNESMRDVVSHEFFHIVTPLTIHSKEIADFDFANPKMSEHLWMYEGVTEYFANLFQINQGLISEEDFYKRISGKMKNAAQMDDSMSFTEMSKNVLVEPYKTQYVNVYEKGALIGMCVDIIIREKSNGKRGILDMMQKLSQLYGVDKAFNDKELFDKIAEITYPEVKQFLITHVQGTTPIDYNAILAKVGVTPQETEISGNPFIAGQSPRISVNPQTKEIYLLALPEIPAFYTSLGIQGNDILLAFNEVNYNLDNIYDLINASETWKDGDKITIKYKRDGVEKTASGTIVLPKEKSMGFKATDTSKDALKQAWLKK